MPNNTINWGQAAATNSNGFGAAVGNNNIDWGKIHAITYGHDETDLVGAKPSYIDIFGAPEIGISFRDLLGTNPNCVVIRRSSDNALETFTVSEVTDGTLTTWTGANDGFIQTWFNQGSGSDFIQNTASRQPKLVSAGVLETENGLPIARRNGVDGGILSTNDFSDAVARSFFYVGKSPLQNFCLIGSSNSGTDYGYFAQDGSVSIYNSALVPSSERLNLAAWSPISRDNVYDDLVGQFLVVVQCTFNYTDTNIRLGFRESNPAGFGMADTQEFIIYAGNTDNTAKETNVNNYWR